MENKHRQSTVDDIYPWMATRTGKAKKQNKTNKPEQQNSPGLLPTNTNKISFVETADTTRDSKVTMHNVTWLIGS